MARNSAIAAMGTVTESLSNERFRVMLDNGADIVAYPCGKMRMNHIRIIVGDRVHVEMSPYDLTNGRILRRV